VRESFGPFHFDMAVAADVEGVTMRVVGWRLGLLPLPAALTPRSTARETQDADGRFRFDVPVDVPLLGRATHYSGNLVAEDVDAPPASAEKEHA
jgi:hypothetical protein